MPLAISSLNFAKERSQWFNLPLRVDDCIMKDSSAAKSALAAALHGSVDGRGLSASKTVSTVQSWVTDGTALLTGTNFIHSLQIRAGTVATKLRSACGHPNVAKRCDACWRTESIGHILQSAPEYGGTE